MKIRPPIEYWKNMVSIESGTVDCFILKENAIELDKYIEKLYDWAIEINLDSITDWVIDDYEFSTKYSIIEDQDENGFIFYKVRRLSNNEMKILFGEKWNEWKDERILAIVYIKVTEEEYNRIKNKR